MKKTVKLIKEGTNLPIEVDVARIVAISAVSEKNNAYYVYFENACWIVKPDNYEEVRKTWLEND